MRAMRLVLGAVLVGAMALVTPGGSASAAQDANYAGVFDGRVVYQGCKAAHPAGQAAVASGTWSMTLHGTSAKGTFNILMNGEPHVAYVFPMMKQALVGPDYTFSVYGQTMAGLLRVTLTDDGQMTYVIAPYSYGGLDCASVTFPGHT